MTLWTPQLRCRRTFAALTLTLLVAASCGSGDTTIDTTSSTADPASTSGPDSGVGTSTARTDTSVGGTGTVATSRPTSAATVATTATTAPSASHTVADLELALADEIGRNYPPGPGQATCEASGTLTDWQPVLCYFLPDEPAEFGGIHVSILPGGRYAWDLGPCCAAGPWAESYASGLLCRDLVEPPSGEEYVPESDHLTYGLAVYYWLTEGRPARMDADGNGRPCETVYPADDVEAFWASARTL